MTNLLEILIWTLPLEGVALFRIGGTYITLPLICCTLIVLWKTLCTLTGGMVCPLSYAGWAACGGIIFAGLLSGLNTLRYTYDQWKWPTSIGYTILLMAFIVAVSSQRLTHTQRERLVRSQLLVASLVALLALYQALALNTHVLPMAILPLNNTSLAPQGMITTSSFGGYVRPTGPFAEPSWLSHYLLLSYLVLYACGAFQSRPRAGSRLAKWIILAGYLSALSLGGFLLGAISALGYLCWRRWDRKSASWREVSTSRTSPTLVASGLVVIGAAVSAFWRSLASRLSLVLSSIRNFILSPSFFDVTESSVMRLSLSGAAIAVWSSSLQCILVGVGVGQFSSAMADLTGVSFGYSGIGWLNVLAEQGVIGALAMIVMFVWIWRREVTVHRDGALWAAVVFALIGAGFTGGLGFERSMKFWYFVALSLVISSQDIAPARGSVPAEPMI